MKPLHVADVHLEVTKNLVALLGTSECAPLWVVLAKAEVALQRHCHIKFVYDPASCWSWQLVRSDLYKRHRFPTEIISHCMWLYHRFDMSFQAVKELLLERSVVLSYETVRRWCVKFGAECARRLKRRRAQLGDHGPPERSPPN